MPTVTEKNAAQQHEGAGGGGKARPRGPHPLPLFLELVRAETAGDRARLKTVLDGVARYQRGQRTTGTLGGDVVRSIGSSALHKFGGRTGGGGRDVLLVPSLVNPPTILDLSERSLAACLADAGHAVHVIDWGEPEGPDAKFGLDDYVARLAAFAGGLERPVVAGYCFGGTLALLAAMRGSKNMSGLATIAAPWDFSAYPERQRRALGAYWRKIERTCAALGRVPMDLVQPAFWSLDPALPARKFAKYADMPEGGVAATAFERLEDWANGGASIPVPAMAEVMTGLFEGNRLHEEADTPELAVPWVDFRSTSDRIVPADAGPPAPDVRTSASGHVGMMIGSRRMESLWEPLARWLQSL